MTSAESGRRYRTYFRQRDDSGLSGSRSHTYPLTFSTALPDFTHPLIPTGNTKTSS